MIGLPLQGVAASVPGAREPSPNTAFPQPPPAPAGPPQPGAAADVLSPKLAAAAAAQGGLAPLLADLGAALDTADLSADAREAAGRVLGFGLDAATAPSADDLQAAVTRSGLFLEAGLATGITDDGDFKAMLLALAQALQPDAEGGSVTTGASRNPPAPPFAGGPVRAQAAAAASPVAQIPPEALAARLLGQTRAVLARQVLMQSASAEGRARGAAGTEPVRWLFELPVAEGDDRAVAQFELSRDGRRGSDADGAETARARVSLDLAGLGPVHATLTLTGAQVRVALWAEEPATAAALAGQRQDLHEALQGEGLSAEVVVRDGAPPSPPAPAGRFMDTAA